MKFIEFLKSIYNRQGKIQGNFAQQGTKTEHIPINQMAIVCGQDLPTLDVALLERCICLTAYKNDYTNEEVDRYKELKDKFIFPFTFETVLKFGIKVITEQQKFIESSDDLKNYSVLPRKNEILPGQDKGKKIQG